MRRRIIKVITVTIALILTVSSTNNVFAWDIGDIGMEDGSTTILPNTEDHHRITTFDIALPTGSGSGYLRLQNHYFDAVNQIGYPTSMTVSMGTNVICDFYVDLTAKDSNGIYHYIEKASPQSYGIYGTVKTRTLNCVWRSCSGNMWVCDDEDYGVFYNIYVEIV